MSILFLPRSTILRDTYPIRQVGCSSTKVPVDVSLRACDFYCCLPSAVLGIHQQARVAVCSMTTSSSVRPLNPTASDDAVSLGFQYAGTKRSVIVRNVTL